jgi:HlyD family secretion protein
MKRLFAHWRIVATAVVVLIILAVALWPDTIEVDLARARRGPLQVTVDEEGETRVRERFVISAPVAGRLQRIELEPGDRVVKGDTILARITSVQPSLLDPRTQAELSAALEGARAAAGQARAERERTAAELSRAQSLLARQRELADAGAISRDQLEASETAVRTAQEALRAAEFSVNRAEYDLQVARARLQPSVSPGGPNRTVDLPSPIDGVVLKRVRESESVVQAGEPLIEVGDPTRLEVVADFLSTEAVRIPANAPVFIEQWGGGHALHGHVRRVEPSGFMKVSALGVEEQRVNVIIDFDDQAVAAKALGDSYRVEVRVVVWEASDILEVPIGALFRRGDDWAVFTVENGRVHAQTVAIAQRNAAEAQVTSGLEEGQAVVLHPPDTLREGVRVAERSGGG